MRGHATLARYPEDGKLAHEFWHNRDLLTYVTLSDNVTGITVDVTYGLLIDTRRRKWTVADVKRQKKLHTFTNIDFSEPLWPVFGTYNPDLVSVEMSLRTGSGNIKFPTFSQGILKASEMTLYSVSFCPAYQHTVHFKSRAPGSKV